MVQLLLPNTYSPEFIEPRIFLAGPIGGAEPWHEQAITYLAAHAPDIWIATPSKNLHPSLLSQARVFEREFPRQTDWEVHHLDHAGYRGANLFWFGSQREAMGKPKHTPDSPWSRAFARDTRPEFGYWLGELKNNPAHVRVVFGADALFDGLSVMKRNIELRVPGTLVHESLEATCDAAIAAVRGRSS